MSKIQGRPGGGSGIPVYPKKIRQPKNTQNSSKYTQNYTQVYFCLLYTSDAADE